MSVCVCERVCVCLSERERECVCVCKGVNEEGKKLSVPLSRVHTWEGDIWGGAGGG